MRIALASERPPKVEAVRAALGRIAALGVPGWSDFDLVTRATDSGVDATPALDGELRQGALQRVRSLQRALEAAGAAAELYLGLEGGVHVESAAELRVWLRSWACAWDGERGAFGCGPSLLLPAAIARPVLGGEDLGVVIDRVAGGADVRSRGGTWGYVTRGLVPRSVAFETAVLSALAPFYHRAAFDAGAGCP